MSRKLALTVAVGGQVYVAGSEPPADVAKQITNGDAWEDGGAGAAADDGATGDSPEEPPRSGKGSGVDEWRAYAESLGIEVPEGAGRDDIIALVDAR